MQPRPSAGTAGPFLPSLRVCIALLSIRSFAEPIPRAQEIPIKPVLLARRVGLPVVAPLHEGRERHQYRLRAASGLQSEERPAVVDEVELDVAAAAVGLEVPLALAVGKAPPPLENRKVSRQKMLADAAREIETEVEPFLVQVVEENPADTARLAAVLEVEVFVAPALEAGIAVRPERVERLPASQVEVARVLLESVVGSQVHSAAEPPYRLALRPCRDQKPQVQVNGRDIRVARMQHQRHAHGFEGAAGALEYAAVLDNAALAAAFAPLPAVGPERATVDALQLRDDAVLQLKKAVGYRTRVHRRDPRSMFFCCNGAVPDVAPVLHSVETDALHDF